MMLRNQSFYTVWWIKKKKDADKFVKRFLQKIDPILTLFISRYANKNLSEFNQFKPFQNEIKEVILA